MILALRTDKPEAELYLLQPDGKAIDSIVWTAHRQLSNTLLGKITELLASNNLQQSDLTGLVSYEGPGSFTGLRIGITVANALAYSLGVQHVGAKGDGWLVRGVELLGNAGGNNPIVTPNYGAGATVTQPRK